MISDRDGIQCPVERCSANMGGYCAAHAKGLLGLAAATVFPLGLINYTGSNALGMNAPYFFSNVKESDKRTMPGSGQTWRNCPQYKRIARRS